MSLKINSAKFPKKIAAFVLTAIVLVLPACSKDDGGGRAFYYPISSNPERLDPQLARGSSEETILLNCMEGLVRVDGDGKVVPGVAKAWEISGDGKTYTFSLREDARWYASADFYSKIPEEFFESFNNTVTANDFVFAFRRAVNPEIGSPLAEKLDQIKNARAIRQKKAKLSSLGVKAIGKHSLKITLTQPDSDFLQSLALAPFYPCSEEFYNATQGRYALEPQYLLCNGAFYLSRWQENLTSVILRKNPEYRGERAVMPDSVTLQVDTNTAQYSARLASGMYSACPLSAADELPSGGSLISVQNRVTVLVFNCSFGILNRAALRSALFGVLELEQITESSALAQGLIPGCAAVGGDNYRLKAGRASFAKADIKKAKSVLSTELKSAGINALELTMLCPPEHEETMRRILQQWNLAFGLLVKTGIEIADTQDLERSAASGEFTVALVTLSMPGQSAYGFLSRYAKNSPDNLPRLSSNSYDSLLDSIRAARDTKAAVDSMLKTESFLLKNGVFLPLFDGESLFALGKNVSGIEFVSGELPDFRESVIFD